MDGFEIVDPRFRAVSVRRLSKVSLNARAPEALAAFFVDALGFANQGAMNGVITLILGGSRLDIAAVNGRAYPSGVAAWSPLFQHFAITTGDIDTAMARLRQQPGWTPITEGGPQRLPVASGGVTAFKFRDPEGHPLELIAFPTEDAAPSRIDHSALSVADTIRSVLFYQRLGLAVGARSLNGGPEQDRLDGLIGAEVEVTALNLPEGRTHLELLGYHGDYRRESQPAAENDVAGTELVFTTAGADELEELRRSLSPSAAPGVLRLRDPDGHRVRIEIAG